MNCAILLAVITTAQVEAFASIRSAAASSRCTSVDVTQRHLFRRRRNKDKANAIDNTAVDKVVEEGEEHSQLLGNSRLSFLSSAAVSATILPLHGAYASEDKQLNLSNEELKKIITSDMVDKSFLVSADITRSIYDESATFTDEIDVYTMDKWIKGTKSLFVASGSQVRLVGDVGVSAKEVVFRFDEDLMFNIPFKPVCSLTGKVVLTRDENTGLITSYREFWDQSVNDVLKSAKFGKKA